MTSWLKNGVENSYPQNQPGSRVIRIKDYQRPTEMGRAFYFTLIHKSRATLGPGFFHWLGTSEVR